MSNRAALAQALFLPRTIALVGASADQAKLASRPQRVLRKHGYGGVIVPINPARSEILGEKAYRAVTAVPGVVDHAFVMVPASAVPDVIADCVGSLYGDDLHVLGLPNVARRLGWFITNDQLVEKMRASASAQRVEGDRR